MLKRYEIQILRGAGHEQQRVADLAGVSERSVWRVEAEEAVTKLNDCCSPAGPRAPPGQRFVGSSRARFSA